MSWEIVGRFAGVGTRKKTVAIFKDKKGWRLYLPSHVRANLGDREFVDLYIEGYKLMVKVPKKRQAHTRHISNGSVRLPLVKLGITLEEGMTRLDILPEMKKDGLVIDLGRYKSL